jgi:hypothetical protein
VVTLRRDGVATLEPAQRALYAARFFEDHAKVQRRDEHLRSLRREDEPDPLALTQHSYSQASAYVILLCRFEWDVEELASHLRIVVQTLMARLRWFDAWTR